jgi:hypothetical protein
VHDCENRGAFVSASASFGGATFERAAQGRRDDARRDFSLKKKND